MAGSFLPGGFGALAGSVRTKSAEAQVLITLTDARTTEQLYVAEGAAKKTDISFGAGGGGYGASGFAALAGGGYSNTDQGKVITAAYFNAFIDLIHYMQSNAAPEAGSASVNAGIQAYQVKGAIVMRDQPSPARERRAQLRPPATLSIPPATATGCGGRSTTRTATAAGCPRRRSARADRSSAAASRRPRHRPAMTSAQRASPRRARNSRFTSVGASSWSGCAPIRRNRATARRFSARPATGREDGAER